jgi:hypothetical protein
MRKIKVLKLGWEFPPLINGGLGVACMGISRALSQKVDLNVIVPKAAPEAKYDGFSLTGVNNLRHEQMETLEEAAAVHGIDVNFLVNGINAYLAAKEG